MISRKLFGFVLGAAMMVAASPASGDGAAPFGPVESRTFHWKAGTNIEKATDACMSNIDWLLIRAPGVANAKSVDVSPKVTQAYEKSTFPAANCSGPDCLPLFVKVTDKDAPGARTVTIKAADGRTMTTTFDVVANAGRCDYPKAGGGKK